MPLRHAEEGTALAIAGIDEDIVAPHRPYAVERGGEELGLAGMGNACEGVARRAGERVEHVALAVRSVTL